jgi:hypothetical protein
MPTRRCLLSAVTIFAARGNSAFSVAYFYRQPEPTDDQLLMIQLTEPSGDVVKVSPLRGTAIVVSLLVRKATTKTWQPFMPD